MKSKAWVIVFKKEILNIVRDTRSLAFTILIPLLLMPMLFYILGFTMNRSQVQVENKFTITINGDTNSPFVKSLISSLKATIVDGDIEENVSSGKSLIGIVIPDDFDSTINEGKTANLQVYFDDSSQNSITAQSRLYQAIDSYSKDIVKNRLTEKGIDPNIINPISPQIFTATKEKDSNGTGRLMLGIILPLLLVVYAATSPISSATDMAAGEKERGTLEPLLTTKASRMSLLLGKYLAIILMSFITVIASLLGMYISFKMNGSILNSSNASSPGISITLPIINVLLIGLFSVATTMTFGAIELSLSIYARSFKEAQTYLTPISIIVMIPTYATLMMDPKNLDTILFSVPIANVACILKELVTGTLNIVHIFITLAWCIIYVLASIFWAKYMFNNEKVLFRS